MSLSFPKGKKRNEKRKFYIFNSNNRRSDEGGLAIAPRPAIGGHSIRGQLH
jgi:hypothetical protein